MFGVPADHRLVATVGRLQPVKNQEVAIDALTHLERVSLLVIGEGPTRAKLASRAGELGLVERVVFTGYRDDPSALIGAVDALVITSKSEGTPLVALEAMAAGTPVIAADVRGLRGFLMHEQNALLVRVDDPVGLASAIERIVGDLSLAERLSHAGIALVARHDGAAMADSYLRLYAELAPGVGET
jgi:glycosyltransferase involved in cell wall biosynthesis